MGKIFCLMGKSSTGKDTIFEALKNDRVLNLKPIVPYTTRPQRTNELDGEAYYFIDIEKLEHYTREGKVIEQRCYKTINGNWYYVTLEAYSNLLKYFNMENIIPIYIEVEDGLRLERALSREKQQIQPNYDELCRRFLADNKDFSEERLNINRITKRYQNLNLDQCIKEIKDRIRTIS